MGRNHTMRAISFFKNAVFYARSKNKVVYNNVVPLRINNGLSGKVILITGGTSGIGAFAVQSFSRYGGVKKVIFTGRKENNCTLPDAEFIRCDVRDSYCCDSVIKNIIERFGDIDILINNAGVYKDSNITSLSEEDYDSVLQTNYFGIKYMTKSFVKYADSAKKHKIINVLSIRSLTSGTDIYAMSKWAGYSYTLRTAKELLDRGFIVNGIAPGPTCSAINNVDLKGNVFNTAVRANYYLDPDQVVNLMWFLASDLSKGVNGQVISIDGGETLL